MNCYHDRTYCVSSQTCSRWAECDRALTPEVELAAKAADLPLGMSWFCPTETEKCFVEKKP